MKRWQLRSATTSSNAWRSCASGRSRPTNGESRRRATPAAPAWTARSRWAVTGTDLPFSSRGPIASLTTASRTSRSVAPAISSSPGVAACSRRARHVHRVTRDERLPSAGLAGDDFARVDADPTDEGRAVVALELLVEESERFPHVARGANGPEGVVLVGGGDAEDGHHRIADELLHGAAMAFDRLGHRCEVPRHHPPDRLGVQSVPERRRARDVAEDHRDGLPDLPGHGRCRLGEGAATCVAEPSSVWVLDTAVGAGSHGRPSLEA